MKTIEQINDDFNVKKPKKKGLIIGGIIVSVVIIALLVLYFLVFTKPDVIFSKAIDKIFQVETEEYNSVKADYKVKVSAETEDKTMQEQLTEIEKCTLKLGAQMDITEKKEIVDLGLEYDNQNVIDAKIYYTDGEMYTYFEGLFDKYIELDLEKEQKEQIEKIFEKLASKEQTKKMVKILRDELKAQIKKEGTFEKTKETVIIGDKEEKVNKSTLVLSQKALINIISNMCSNLANNDKFLECVEEESIKDVLKESATKLQEIEEEEIQEDILNIRIDIYTKGFLNSFVGANIEIEVNTGEQKVIVNVMVLKQTKDLYSYSIKMKTQGVNAEVVSGKIENQKEEESKNIQKGKIIITADVAEYLTPIKPKLEIDYSVEYNNEIDNINTSNSINIIEMTEEDVQGIMKKLMERPLIGDLITSMNGGLFDKAEQAKQETEKAMLAEVVALTKAEILAEYYSEGISIDKITEAKVKEIAMEYLEKEAEVKVTKTPGKLEFTIIVDGIEEKLDLESINNH